MSGVAKDDTNPSKPSDETAAAPETSAADVPAAIPHDDAEPRARRSAPHLRVVTDADTDFTAEAPIEGPQQRIGAIIRAARENAGYSLEQVSRDTRVHLSHLRAIEEMTPNLLGAPVYAKGYIKSYARFLGMDEQNTLDRYLAECAILKDPEKQDIAQPASSKARKLPVAVPMLGFLIVGLVGAAAVVFLNNGEKQPASVGTTANTSTATPAAVDPANAVGQRLRIVALRPGSVEVRSAKGDKYVHRDFVAGESYPVRVGAGWTVSVNDGKAFEWRLGDASLGLLQPEGGQVYSQSVDLAAQRAPVNVPPVVDPSIAAETSPTPSANGAPPVAGAAPAPGAATTPPKPRAPRPATSTTPAPRELPAAQNPAPAQPQTPATDPALAAYPDQ